jgi:hypothetical protein
MAVRFFGSIVGGILIAVGEGILFSPFVPADTWTDVWRQVFSCGVIGFIGGAIVGTLWCAYEAWRRFVSRSSRDPEKTLQK